MPSTPESALPTITKYVPATGTVTGPMVAVVSPNALPRQIVVEGVVEIHDEPLIVQKCVPACLVGVLPAIGGAWSLRKVCGDEGYDGGVSGRRCSPGGEQNREGDE